MGTNSTTESHQGIRMRSLAVIVLFFSSGVLGALECWGGGCGMGDGACSEDDYPSLVKINCTENLCGKSVGYYEDKLFRNFGCGDDSHGWGCWDAPDEEGMTDVENCLCDSPLCNTAASEQAFATLFAFALFFLSTVFM